MYSGIPPAISAKRKARFVASPSASGGRVSACHFGSVCFAASARFTRTSMTPPFSACMQMSPPFSAVCESALKIEPSSTWKTPGYAMNSLNDETPSLTMTSISLSTLSVTSRTIMCRP